MYLLLFRAETTVHIFNTRVPVRVIYRNSKVHSSVCTKYYCSRPLAYIICLAASQLQSFSYSSRYSKWRCLMDA